MAVIGDEYLDCVPPGVGVIKVPLDDVRCVSYCQIYDAYRSLVNRFSGDNMWSGRQLVHAKLIVFGVCCAGYLPAQSLDTATALAALREAAAACTADNGALWHRSLCGPIALVDPQTRLVVANDTVGRRSYVPYAGAIITTAPNNVGFANTSFDWNGRRWAMILMPLPTDRFDRITLVMHEVFHREQDSLHLAGQDPPNNQLDQTQGRYWFRLELHALAAALDALSTGSSQVRRHTENALLFRARRYALYPLADSLERMLEIQEGLAEYTGERLAMSATGENSARVARHVRDFETNPTFVRSFAYATGPALLLDHFAPDWRSEIARSRNPAQLLSTALAFRPHQDLARAADRAAGEYGAHDVMVSEAARDSARRPVMAGYKQRLVDGPTLTLTQTGLARGFNPQTLVGFDMVSTVYPTGSFGAQWGSLQVTDGGALVANDYSSVRISAPESASIPPDRTLRGQGWVLKLNEGWGLQPAPGRPGSFLVRKTS
jgi:hypothetical protein